MTKENTWENGRSWEVAKAGRFFMTCFDAFGNRDLYDYFIWDGSELLVRHNKIDEVDAMKKFKAILKKHGGQHAKVESPATDA